MSVNVKASLGLTFLVLAMALCVFVAAGWGLLVCAAMVPFLIWRLLDEEKLLAKELPGYAAYLGRVTWRLIPGIY